jgi:hypothetical protein
MINKFAAWKMKHEPKVTTNQIAKILGVSRGWVSTLLNQPDENIQRRCSFDLALKIQLMTGGDVSIEELMISPGDYLRIKKEVKGRYRKYAQN